MHFQNSPKRLFLACGMKTVSTETLIVGGNNAKKGDYPWQVGIYTKINTELNDFVCGGSLINERTILTGTKFKLPKLIIMLYYVTK